MGTPEGCRRDVISSATFYKWKAKYTALEVSEAGRLCSLHVENAPLKRLLADAILDNAMLKEITAKRFLRLSPSNKRWLIPSKLSR